MCWKRRVSQAYAVFDSSSLSNTDSQMSVNSCRNACAEVWTWPVSTNMPENDFSYSICLLKLHEKLCATATVWSQFKCPYTKGEDASWKWLVHHHNLSLIRTRGLSVPYLEAQRCVWLSGLMREVYGLQAGPSVFALEPSNASRSSCQRTTQSPAPPLSHPTTPNFQEALRCWRSLGPAGPTTLISPPYLKFYVHTS